MAPPNRQFMDDLQRIMDNFYNLLKMAAKITLKVALDAVLNKELEFVGL